jgi:hypothetical protein
VLLTVTGGTEQSASTYSGTSNFSGVVAASAGLKTVEVSYTNNTSTARTATLTVNGQTSTKVSFPPTGSSAGNISVNVSLTKGSANTLSFSGAPTLDGIVVRPLPGKNGNTGELLDAVASLLGTWTLGVRESATLARLLADTEGLRPLGQVTNRLGRSGQAYVYDGSGSRKMLIMDPATGAVLGLETTFTKAEPEYGVKAGDVMSYSAWMR